MNELCLDCVFNIFDRCTYKDIEIETYEIECEHYEKISEECEIDIRYQERKDRNSEALYEGTKNTVLLK